jgi:hypothetical protein
MKPWNLCFVSLTVVCIAFSLVMAENNTNGMLQGSYGFNTSLVCVQGKPDESGMFPALPHFDPETQALLVEGEVVTYNMIGTIAFDGEGTFTSSVQTILLYHQRTSPDSIPAPQEPGFACEGSYTVDADRAVEVAFECTQQIPGDPPLTAKLGPAKFQGFLGADNRILVTSAVESVVTPVQILAGEMVVSGYEGMCGGVQTYTRLDRDPLYLAQFGNGVGGFTSDIVLTNPSTASEVSGTVDFTDDNGDPLSVGMASGGDPVSSVDFSVQPLGAVTLSTDGEGDLKVGSAKVESDGNLGGVIRFNFPGVGSAGFGSSQALTGFVSPVQRQAGGLSTGLALFNPGEEAVTLNLSLRDESGEVVTGGTQTLEDFPSQGHLARFIQELFQGANTDDFRGSLVVEAVGGRVAASIMEFDAATAKFTTLPVTPLD